MWTEGGGGMKRRRWWFYVGRGRRGGPATARKNKSRYVCRLQRKAQAQVQAQVQAQAQVSTPRHYCTYVWGGTSVIRPLLAGSPRMHVSQYNT